MIEYCGEDAGGTGRNARKLPLATTGTDAPLMVSDARPLPTVPKMKLESRD
jgi:hypothetical protein